MNSEPANPTFKVGLTSEEKKLYTQLFKSLDPSSSGIITGETARTTFEKSGVLPPILGEIWQIADQNNLGFLSQFGFCQAMRLIGYAQAGKTPSAELADYPGPLPKFSNLGLDTSLQPQHSSNSFMKSQPTSSFPQNSTTLQATPQDPISAVSQADYDKFSSLFAKTVGSVQGELSGAKAKDIFLKAKLPTPTLGHIWNLVDRQNSGKLSVSSFVIAMHLIQGLLGGTIRQLPPFLPESLWQSVNRPVSTQSSSGSRQSSYGSVNQQVNRSPSLSSRKVSNASINNNDWTITPVMKQQYDSIFASIDTTNSGSLNSSQVASFLMKSNLNQQDLATIWDLSDIQNTGQFGKNEFSIALFLVNKRLAGDELPNIIPHSLIDSLRDNNLSTQQVKTPTAPVPPKPVQKAKTSMDDLVDIFGSSNQPIVNVNEPARSPIQRSISDLSHEIDSPKIRKSLTGSFKPTSNFGQNLINNNLTSPKEEVEQEILLGDDVHHERIMSKPQIAEPPKEKKVVNYEALRAVPTPPINRPQEDRSLNTNQEYAQSPVIDSTSSIQNNDLLADNDPEISGKLSQANSDIANVSNQIKSLTGRTTELHDKKIKAQQELGRILKSKEEIEGKLVQLKTLYDNEVQQVETVEKNLALTKEQSEALRSEASISEAKLNALSGELNEKNIAHESLEQENEALKQKLAQMNVGIVELEKSLEEVTANNQALSNQVSVKKSQVQVSLVKSEELKAQISKLQAENKQIEQDILNAENEKNKLDEQNISFEKEVGELKSFKPKIKSSNKSLGTGIAVASAAGIVGTIGTTIGKPSNELENKFIEQKQVDKSTNFSKGDLGIPTESVPGDFTNDIIESGYLNKDVNESEGVTEDATNATADTLHQDEDQVMKKFPNLSVCEPTTETDNVETTVTSIATTYKGEQDETPVTSPSNSDFQISQDLNEGIPGGMVGMPGALLGMSRTDSLTSSVQNNAALSVRDDNIGEISDMDTIENKNIMDSDVQPAYDYKQSPGTESFEIVNAEEIKSKESLIARDNYEDKNNNLEPPMQRDSVSTIPQAHSAVDEEFPPIKELDYDESSSSDNESQADEFDDAVDHLYTPTNNISGISNKNNESQQSQPFDDFDNQFSNLEPAAPEDDKDDFENNFIGMEEAQDDNLPDEFTDQFGNESNVPGFSDDFTGTPNLNNQPFTYATENDNNIQGGGNDEWEQLFAGFGNSKSHEVSEPVVENSKNGLENTIDNSHQQAVHELVGMGFEEDVAIDALERENWNLESATNYLLDNA